MSPELDVGYARQEYPPLPEAHPTSWRYDMRRQMQEIIPNLFLGPYGVATKNNFSTLKQMGVTHVVCVRQVVERNIIRPNFPDTFRYHIVEMADNCFERIIPHCKSTCEFLQECLDSGGKALVHGNGGACRSAALVIAFIMYRYGVTTSEAHKYVQSRRFCINPNDNFMTQLKEFEPIYKAHAAMPAGPCVVSSLKRPIEDCNSEFTEARGPPFSNLCTNRDDEPDDENMSD